MPTGLPSYRMRRAAVQQRRVADVGVADHPADVGGGPERLAGIDVVVVLHGPLERHHVPAVVAHDALGLAGGAGGVEDVERIGGLDRDAAGLAAARLGVGDRARPSRGRARRSWTPPPSAAAASGPSAACGWQARWRRRAAACSARCGRARCRRRPTGSPPAWQSSMRVASSGAAKPPNTTEWMAPMRAQASIADHRLGHHRHVDDDPVALCDAQVLQHAAERRHLVAQLGIGVGARRLGDGAVVDQRLLLRARPRSTCRSRQFQAVLHSAPTNQRPYWPA